MNEMDNDVTMYNEIDNIVTMCNVKNDETRGNVGGRNKVIQKCK